MAGRWTYTYNVTFDLMSEAGITPPAGVTVDNFTMGSITLWADNELTEQQKDNFRSLLSAMFNNKFNATTCDVMLHTWTGV